MLHVSPNSRDLVCVSNGILLWRGNLIFEFEEMYYEGAKTLWIYKITLIRIAFSHIVSGYFWMQICTVHTVSVDWYVNRTSSILVLAVDVVP